MHSYTQSVIKCRAKYKGSSHINACPLWFSLVSVSMLSSPSTCVQIILSSAKVASLGLLYGLCVI